MDEFKKYVGEWMKHTQARVREMQSCATDIRSAWEEIKENVMEKSKVCIERENRDENIQQKLNMISTELDLISWGLERGGVTEKQKAIGLDELVVDFYEQKEVAVRKRKEGDRRMAYARVEDRVDEMKDREAEKLLHGQGALLDAFARDAEYEKSVSHRVTDFLVEYLKVDDEAFDLHVDEETVQASISALPVRCNSACELRSRESLSKEGLVGVCLPMLCNAVHNLDCYLLKYMFDEGLDMREVLIASSTFSVRREDMLTIASNETLSRKVVDLYVELLTVEEHERRGNMALCWWIPTYVTRPVEDEHYVVQERSTWLQWAGNVDEVRKIYVPVKMKEYWFVAVILVEDCVVHVLCSVREIVIRDCLAVVDDVLRSLDTVFMDDIIATKPLGWRFAEFEIVKAPEEVMEDSTGKFVIQVMQSARTNGKLWDNGPLDSEPGSFALQLVKCNINRARMVVVKSAMEVVGGVPP